MSDYDLRIQVEPRFLPEQSDPDDDRYVFAYTVTITNTGRVAAQLISRHWIITDAHGRATEVRGLGVVGHQPLLRPGESFEYTSGSPLPTPSGSMRGEYFFVAEDGARFEMPIAEFALVAPGALH